MHGHARRGWPPNPSGPGNSVDQSVLLPGQVSTFLTVERRTRGRRKRCFDHGHVTDRPAQPVLGSVHERGSAPRSARSDWRGPQRTVHHRRHDESERLARRVARAHAGRSTRVRSCSAVRQRCALFHRSHRRGGDGAARQGDLRGGSRSPRAGEDRLTVALDVRRREFAKAGCGPCCEAGRSDDVPTHRFRLFLVKRSFLRIATRGLRAHKGLLPKTPL